MMIVVTQREVSQSGVSNTTWTEHGSPVGDTWITVVTYWSPTGRPLDSNWSHISELVSLASARLTVASRFFFVFFWGFFNHSLQQSLPSVAPTKRKLTANGIPGLMENAF